MRAGHHRVAGVDEVGRGALAGPVTVGVVVVTEATGTAPAGLRDSKLLTPAARDELAPRLRRWAASWGVGHAEPEEIDALGILRALRLAGARALAGTGAAPDAVVLDGDYDWLDRPEPPPSCADLPGAVGPRPAVVLAVRADVRCSAVAAASVLAKTTRDAIMVQRSRAAPHYGWDSNKGYAAPQHVTALQRVGPCAEHRLSWQLPGSVSSTGGRRPSAVAGVVDPWEPALVEGMMGRDER